MSFVRVNKVNAWNCWQQGLIAGGNTSLIDLNKTCELLGAGKGFNALRLWLNYNGDGYWLVPTDYVAIANNGWNQTIATTVGQRNPAAPDIRTYAQVAQKIQSVLDTCATLGVGVILTLNFWSDAGGRMWVSQPADPTPLPKDGYVQPDPYTEATTPEMAQQYLINFWKATAERFGTHQALIGYDVLNEPAPATGAVWATLANRIVDAIRTKDAVTPVIVEGCDFGNNLKCFYPDSPTTGSPVADALVTGSTAKKVVFSVHAYAPSGATHHGLADWAYESMGMPYPPAEAWNLTTGVKSALSNASQLASLFYQQVISFKRTYKVPVFVGEFSYINQSGAPEYYELNPGNAHRLVTRIQRPASGATDSVELVMGQLDANGFRIDCAPDTAGVYENTVRLTLSRLPTELRDTSVDSTIQDGWAQLVDRLGVTNKDVTIRRAGNSYVVQVTGTPEFISPVNGTTPVALISLRPSLPHQALQDASRTTYAKQVVRMCQNEGFSWAWHAMDDVGSLWWCPNAGALAVLRDAAMGRKIIA